MTKPIRHEETSRDSLYVDFQQILEQIYGLWLNGNNTLRFAIPMLCAIKLEAFINVAGKLKVAHWEMLERKLSFAEKCQMVFAQAGIAFDPAAEPNKTAVALFEIRNSLVHPKMRLEKTDELVSEEEYTRRSTNFSMGTHHHLRGELTAEKVKSLRARSDEFVANWGPKLLDGNAEYWLSGGSTGGFTWQGQHKSSEEP